MSNTVKQLGFIPTNRGEFDTTGQTKYYKDNVVQYRNGSYICSPVGYSSSNPTAYTTDAPYQDGDTQLNANWKLMASVGLVDEEPVAESDNLVKSGGVQNELALGAVYDVSAKNPIAGPNNDGKFESLSALLSDANLSTLIPASVRKGGMSIKFVQSSDNKYSQYFLTKNEWSASEADWQKMNLEEKVSQLGQKISRLMSFSDMSSYIGNLTGTGASGDSGRYKVIPIKPNDEITIYPVTATGCYYFITKSFDSQNTETFETATGFSGRQSTVQNVTIEIPFDGYFLIVATSIYSNTCVPNNITINGISIMNELVSQIETNKLVGEESSAYLFKVAINEADAYLSEAGLMPGDFHCKYTSKILCKKNDVFHYQGSSLYTSPCAAVVYDKYGAVVDSWKPNSSSVNADYTISANSAAFVIFSSYLEGTSSEPTLEVNKVGNYITLEDAVDDLNKRFDDKFALYESVNLFNNQDPLIKNGLYGVSSFVANDDYRVTGPIAVKGGVSYKFPHYNNVFGSSKRYAIVDAENNVIQVVLDSTATDYFTITPSFDCFISCQLTPSTLDSFMVCKASEYPSSYVPYTKYVYLKGTKVYSSDIIGQIDNPLYEKKISFNGDSICQGISASGGYGVIIATENEMEYQNIGISGGTICGDTYYPGGETPRHWISRTIQNMDSDSDFAIVEGGVNDMWNGLTLGTLSVGYDAALDDTTFYGAMESVCKQLTTRYAGKKYGFIIVHCVDTGWYYKTSNYYKAIIECCNKWGVPFIDLNLLVPPLGLFPQSATALYAIRSQYTYNADGCHLTQDGYKKFYTDKITDWLKSL